MGKIHQHRYVQNYATFHINKIYLNSIKNGKYAEPLVLNLMCVDKTFFQIKLISNNMKAFWKKYSNST